MDPSDILDQALALCELKYISDLSTLANYDGRSPAVQILSKSLSFLDKISAASRRLPRLGEISGVIACLPRQESRAQSVSGDTAAVVFISATLIEACTGLQGYLFEKHNSFPDGTETRTGTYVFALPC
ncbi:hypothetical protein M5K25_002528 [Dendrobium thyrsiflorum]|uniref:Uncharacterized protein n=1 Tax=Dendrobium thyrsiflorum TaxID=117978 RepID=A0ABD0VMT1_DENTH